MSGAKEHSVRCFTELRSELFAEEKYRTGTSDDQKATERLVQRCFDRFEQLAALDLTLPSIHRSTHIHFLENSLQRLSTAYQCLDSSRPWLVYWILNAAYLLNHRFSEKVLDSVIDFLIKCRSPNGGFAGGPGQYPHLAPTYASVNSLCIIGTPKSYQAIDKASLREFLWSVRHDNGSFKMHVEGEVDVRGAYCAISCAKLTSFDKDEERKLFKNTAQWIASCQTYEGGFGGAPDLEAHGGYSFCGAAALTLLGTTAGCNLSNLLRWTVNRQMRYEGGFQGRTNKLVDGCYSFWQGALIPIVQALIIKNDTAFTTNEMKKLMFHREALQEYVLICCQSPTGGLIDKPEKPADLYHTCYTLSGLSISQHCQKDSAPLVIGNPDNEVLPIHPLHNVSPKAVLGAFEFFQGSMFTELADDNSASENVILEEEESSHQNGIENESSMVSTQNGVDRTSTSRCSSVEGSSINSDDN